MRVGFLGNPANYPFLVARAMRRTGHDVIFVIDSPQPLCRPEYRYRDVTFPYPDWILDFSLPLPPIKREQIEFTMQLLGSAYSTPQRKRIERSLRSCEALVLSGFGTSAIDMMGKPAFVMLVGYDLETLASSQTAENMLRDAPLNWKLPWKLLLRSLLRRVSVRQGNALRQARGVSYFLRGLVPRGDEILDELGVRSDRCDFIMMTDSEEISFSPQPHNPVIRLFCGARLSWKKPFPTGMSALDDKGTDIMIRGIAQFSNQTGTAVDLRLVRKGIHVRQTEELIKEVGLESSVTWLSEMSQAAVVDEYRKADIVFDQVGPAFFGMVALDAMACGRPVIANGRPEILEPALGAASPLCQARSVDEVASQLARLASSAGIREQVGLESRRYVERFFSPARAAELIVRRLGGVST